MAQEVVTIKFEVDGISGTVSSVEELQNALKGIEGQAEKTANSVKDVADAADDMGKKTEEASEAGEGAITLLDEATGGLATRFVQIKTGLGQLAKGFKTSFLAGIQGASALQKALIATGIGAIVVAVGLLVAYWEDIKGLVNGVGREQRQLLEETEATAAAAQEQLEATTAQEETLKAQGMTEEEIRDLKIQQTNEVIAATEAQLEQQKALKKAQVEAAERNQKILAGILAFLTAPITGLLGAVDALTYGLEKIGVIEKATSLAKDFTMGTASLLFDPEDVAEEGDELIKETQEQLTRLKNQRDGYENRKKADAKKRREEEKAEREKAAEEEALTQKELQQELEDLRAKNIVDAEEEALALLEIERKRARAELEAKGASQELLLEFDKQYAQRRQEILDQYQAERDAKEEEEKQKFLDNRRIIEEALQQANLESIENTYRRAEEELRIQEEAQLRELEMAGATEEELQSIRDLYSKKRKDLAKDEADYKISLDKMVADANLDIASQAFGAIASIVGEGSAVGKAAAIAQTTIDTYVGAQKAYTSQLIPGDPTSPIRAAIAAGIAIAAGVANVAKIVATPTPSAGGASNPVAGGPTPPAIPQFNPQAVLAERVGDNVEAPGDVTSQQTGSQSTIVRAYVVDSEVTSQQEATRKIENLASL